jgi:sugar phosphate isomerase/epimerase
VGASPEEMDKIMKETGLGFCLDFGHALCYAAWARKPWAGVIADFLKLKPKVFHLSDGDVDSLKDAHEHLGTGNYDLGTMIRMIPEDGCVALETNHDSREHLDDFQRDVDYFRRMRNGC